MDGSINNIVTDYNLVVSCSKAIANGSPIPKSRMHVSRKADLAIGQGGISRTVGATGAAMLTITSKVTIRQKLT